MNKKTLIERNIHIKFFMPALEKTGWFKNLQILEEIGFEEDIANMKVGVCGYFFLKNKTQR